MFRRPSVRIALAGSLALALAAVVLSLYVIPSAHARSSLWSPVPNGPFDLPAGFCAFPVHGDILVNREFMKVAILPDGTEVDTITGTVKARLTNVNTGKVVDLNASGPGTDTFYPDGSFAIVSEGLGLAVFPPQDQQAFGEPGLIYTSGRFTRTVDSNFNTTSFTHDGNLTDVCALLS